MEIYLNNDDAKACLYCTKQIIEGKESPEGEALFTEVSEKIKEDMEQLYNLRDFLNITVNSGLDTIVIPERYYKVYNSVKNIALIMCLDYREHRRLILAEMLADLLINIINESDSKEN